jgi:colanic acid biosynthesis glycosyl transferase WcaI
VSKRVLVIYHFFYPDDVVSARHLSGLATGLAKRGWEVTALTSNRFCRDPKARIDEKEETWEGVRIHRSWRPALPQSSNVPRLLNAFWLMASWLFFILRERRYEVIVLGTDPQFSYFVLPFIRVFKPRTKLVSWGFDLYPEAIMVSDMGLFSRLAGIVKPFAGFCYKRLDGMVDIGPCMRRLLDRYGHNARRATLVPWALVEPEAPFVPHAETRKELFGNAKLTVLYAGTIGKAHEFEHFIALARELRARGADVAFCFAGRGNCYEDLRAMVSEEDTNIGFAGFAAESELDKRLSAGDIHMLSLRPGWDGVVLPSKFFGSMAAGRPLLYEGSTRSSIKTWIEEYDLGYVVNAENVPQIADELCRLAEDPGLLREKQQIAFDCYRERFAKEKVINGWDDLLRELTGAPSD